MYVYIYICIYVYLYLYLYLYIYICIYVYLYLYIYNIYISTYTSIYIYTHRYVYIYIYTWTCRMLPGFLSTRLLKQASRSAQARESKRKLPQKKMSAVSRLGHAQQLAMSRKEPSLRTTREASGVQRRDSGRRSSPVGQRAALNYPFPWQLRTKVHKAMETPTQ